MRRLCSWNTLRYCVAGLAALLAAGCAATSQPREHEYLDENTAATVTVGHDTLVFARERPELAVNARDYLTVVPVDVNRAGKHAVYLFGYAWSTIDKRGVDETPGAYEIVADDRSIGLALAPGGTRELGIGTAPLPPPSRTAVPVVAATSREILRFIVAATDVRVLRTRDGLVARFALWHDGRPALDEFLQGGGATR
jgi:hypothetical protein